MSDLLLLNPLNGEAKPSWAYEAADILLKKLKNNGLWGSMDFYMQMWLKKNPHMADQFYKARQELTASRRNKHATFKNKSNRMLATIPGEFISFAEKYFNDELNSMGKKKFFETMARRYPIFKVPEVI